MWRKREVEQLMIREQQRDMEAYLVRMLEDTELDVDVVRELFLEQFPGEEHFFVDFLNDYLS